MGGFVEDQGALLPCQLRQPGSALLFRRRQKALKGESSGGQAGYGKGGHRRTGPRHHLHLHPCLPAEPHQLLPRIADTGHACVRHHGGGFPCPEPLHNPLCAADAAVVVIADQGLVYVKMGQQPPGHPGVLCGDKIHLAQGVQLPHGNIPQISDGGAHDI